MEIDRDRAESRLTVIMSQMVRVNEAAEAAADLEIEKLDEMMTNWWLDVRMELTPKKIAKQFKLYVR